MVVGSPCATNKEIKGNMLEPADNGIGCRVWVVLREIGRVITRARLIRSFHVGFPSPLITSPYEFAPYRAGNHPIERGQELSGVHRYAEIKGISIKSLTLSPAGNGCLIA
jgi:hypothetical protein